MIYDRLFAYSINPFNDILHLETVQDQIEASDILLATHTDLASPELVRIDAWNADLFPQKTHVEHIVHGQISIDILDKVSNRTHIQTTHAHKHKTDHHHHDHHDHHSNEHDHHDHDEHIITTSMTKSINPKWFAMKNIPLSDGYINRILNQTFGWICWSGLVFDAVSVDNGSIVWQVYQALFVQRLSVRTNEGWWGFQLLSVKLNLLTPLDRRDSRIEVIIKVLAMNW